MSPIDSFLKEIQDHPIYPGLVELLKENIPVLPLFDPKTDNTEVWKDKSGRRQGFLLCASLLKIDLGE